MDELASIAVIDDPSDGIVIVPAMLVGAVAGRAAAASSDTRSARMGKVVTPAACELVQVQTGSTGSGNTGRHVSTNCLNVLA